MIDENRETTIDELFSVIAYSNERTVNHKYFKEIADLYLCKHNIPYTRETSGSCVVYRCPFVSDCSFCIRGGICRSKEPSKKGLLSIRSICLQHSCKWQDTPRENRITNYRPTYKNRQAYLDKQKDGTLYPGISSYIDMSDKHLLVHNPENTLISNGISSSEHTLKRPSKQDVIQSKRPMYCRNAYTQSLVKKLIKQNPYLSLRSILTLLESKGIECKEVTVSRYRNQERANYLTPMKNIISSFNQIKSTIHSMYPKDDIEIVTSVGAEKEHLVMVYVCPESSRVIYNYSHSDLFVDCMPLQNETGGVLFAAFTLDGGNQSVLLAYMIAEEENHHNWKQFVSFLETSQLLSPANPVYTTIHSLIQMIETLYPVLVTSIPDLANPTSLWYSTNNRRKKSSSMNFNSLRSVFYRIIFSSTDTSVMVEKFFNDYRDVFSKLTVYPKWNRRLFSNQIVSESIIKDFDVNVLEHRYIRHLMLDDIVSGLYTILIEKSRERYQYYLANMQVDKYTPYYTSVMKEYKKSYNLFSIKTHVDSVYTLVANNSALLYTVDLNARICSCGYWQQFHFPCIHAWSALQATKQSVDSYVNYFTCENAMKMAPQSEPVTFKHELEQQVYYYIHAMDSPSVDDTFWESTAPLTSEKLPEFVNLPEYSQHAPVVLTAPLDIPELNAPLHPIEVVPSKPIVISSV